MLRNVVMAARSLSESEGEDALRRDTGLAVSGHYHWEQGANKNWLRVRIPVLGASSLPHTLRIVVSVNNTERTKYDFTLLMDDPSAGVLGAGPGAIR